MHKANGLVAERVRTANSLTPKQEKFCLLVSSGSSNSEAYREAYRADKMLPNTVHREAHRLTQNPMVATRISALKVGVESDTRATVVEARRWVLGRLQEEATYAGTAGARIRALELLGKAVGLFDESAGDDITEPKSSAEILEAIEERLSTWVQPNQEIEVT